jgi:hypothetical protein
LCIAQMTLILAPLTPGKLETSTVQIETLRALCCTRFEKKMEAILLYCPSCLVQYLNQI